MTPTIWQKWILFGKHCLTFVWKKMFWHVWKHLEFLIFWKTNDNDFWQKCVFLIFCKQKIDGNSGAQTNLEKLILKKFDGQFEKKNKLWKNMFGKMLFDNVLFPKQSLRRRGSYFVSIRIRFAWRVFPSWPTCLLAYLPRFACLTGFPVVAIQDCLMR